MSARLVPLLLLSVVIGSGCTRGSSGDSCDCRTGPCDDACPSCPDALCSCDLLRTEEPDESTDRPPEESSETDGTAQPDTGTPTYWTPEATRVADDPKFLTWWDEASGRMRPFFGLGVHPEHSGAWDGITGMGQCRVDPETGTIVGHVDNGTRNLHEAAEAGANLAYLWAFVPDPDFLAVDPPLFGLWHPQSGSLGPGHEAIPVMVCPWGEEDMSSRKMERIEEMRADFEDFRRRRGRWSPERAPNLPPFERLPWYCWHPSFRMIGGGDGYDDYLEDEVADAFARTTNFLIGDTYTYVCNPFESGTLDAIVQGQRGEKGECYDDWLAWDDPDHRRLFTSGWDLAHSLRRRADPDAVIWMWIQGYAFDDGIGRGECWSGRPSDSWARGPFPTQRYLRKEILSVIAAGATGIIFFGYGYNRETTAAQIRVLLRALSSPEVYGPALMSPRLVLDQDTTFLGPEGRVHALVKWDAASRRAYLLGANPGAKETPFEVTFPWSIARVEILDWNLPAFEDLPADRPVALAERTLRWVAPADEGFILRITPLFAD